jgi:uncharacterized heparinase superfamily protein
MSLNGSHHARHDDYRRKHGAAHRSDEIFTLAKAGKEIEGSDRVKNGSAVLAIRKEARAITTILNDKEHDMIT